MVVTFNEFADARNLHCFFKSLFYHTGSFFWKIFLKKSYRYCSFFPQQMAKKRLWIWKDYEYACDASKKNGTFFPKLENY